MELVISKQSMMSTSECVNYPIPEGTWAKFKFECCYADGRATISKDGTTKAQLSMSNDEVVVRESGTFAICVLGRNTKSSVYVTLIHEADRGTVVVEAGDNITVDKRTSEGTVIYTVSGTEQGSHTIVKAGDNVTVTSAAEGNKTAYTVSATVPTPPEQRVYDVASTTPDTLTVSKVVSGNTTTFNLAATGGGTGTDVEITSTDSNLIITKV